MVSHSFTPLDLSTDVCMTLLNFHKGAETNNLQPNPSTRTHIVCLMYHKIVISASGSYSDLLDFQVQSLVLLIGCIIYPFGFHTDHRSTVCQMH